MLSCVPPLCSAVIGTCQPVENLNVWTRLKAWACRQSFLGLQLRIPPGCECYQVEVFATRWSLAQESPTDCGASLRVIWKHHEWAGHGPVWSAAPRGGGGGLQCFIIVTNRKLKQTFVLPPSCYLSFCKYSTLMIDSYFPTIYFNIEFEVQQVYIPHTSQFCMSSTLLLLRRKLKCKRRSAL